MTAGSADGGRSRQLRSSGLRPGWTTGACAAGAARAAYRGLLTGDFPDPVTVLLPGDRAPAFALTDARLDGEAAVAAITKDAGDDPDVTHGAVIRVRVRRAPAGSGVSFAAGPGVGTVTLPGLPVAVGEPAINPRPRAMIVANLRAATTTEDPLDLVVEVGIDRGQELARHTLNPRLGIVGGLSVLGTTGVVVPYSCSAWIDSIRRGIDVALAAGQQHLAACTGSTSEAVAGDRFGLPELALIDMGDFAGAVLKYLRSPAGDRCRRLTLCGGVAKLSKLAAGHLDLHSGRSSVDPDYLARLATQAGASGSTASLIQGAATVLEALELAAADQVDLGQAIAEASADYAQTVLARPEILLHVVCIDRAGAVVGESGPSLPH
ncbi:MAG: cobalt-precorrin-5B (C(1))-methyltransferase [Austwickia sp.]|jgi:cobalt-precorrin-5B (C1)-methyltransferase|nr:cobalt-precorrin-5B (C(1))-methyltransferase [Austwickia sp.]MBK8437864.1 cobalt-precorrin-5B (C(1))-methyltransferase [Austwickia sp.]